MAEITNDVAPIDQYDRVPVSRRVAARPSIEGLSRIRPAGPAVPCRDVFASVSVSRVPQAVRAECETQFS
ncbi:hypothetical protein C6Q07_01345 [Burkholderia multivorans]|nr:hypothetical protein C6Q07_01345 [Burkholderia multivorans]